MSVRIAPPSLPPHHSDPATRYFQSYIPVEVLLAMAAVESGARSLTLKDVDDWRRQVYRIQRHTKVLRSNLTWDQRTALKVLRRLEDQVILLVNKWDATVMMRRCNYDGKMEEMLRTCTYGKRRGQTPYSNPGQQAEL